MLQVLDGMGSRFEEEIGEKSREYIRSIIREAIKERVIGDVKSRVG